MKRILSVISITVVLFSCNSDQNDNSKQMKDYGLEVDFMDTTVRPQDDFYNYVNGSWMKTTEIPSDKPSWGSFNKLAEDTDVNALKILDNLLKEQFEQGSEGQKIQDLYASYMDLDKRNKEGINPIQPILEKIDTIKDLESLQNYMIEATPDGDNILYGWGISPDLKNSKMNAVYLGNPPLGLGRDYYQKESETNEETIDKYREYIALMLEKLDYKNSSEAAEKIIAFEKSLAATYLTNEQIRDARLIHNPRTIPELKKLVNNVNLPDFLEKVGVKTDEVIVGEINFYNNFDKLINQQNLETIKDYLKFHLLDNAAGFLSEELDNMKFEFYSKYLRGQQEQRALNKRGYSIISWTLGEAFGKLYVEKYFPPEAKAQMEELIEYLRKSFAQHIENLVWMSDATKERAMEKLNKFRVKVAYPDQWKDYSELVIQPENSLFENLQAISEWQYARDLKEVGQAVDKDKWEMTPQTVNAYYHPLNNEIVFPAAILQPPFFNPKADPAFNFGGIGAVIGHEMTHGFDDSGSQFDTDGNLIDWWTPEDKENFKKVTDRLILQYDRYEPVPGSFINGTFTNGENIADLGGVNIAYDALQMYLKDKGDPGDISGYSQNQRFFLSWATVWRTKASEEYMVNQVKVDPHSPGYFRSFGPLVNTDAFYDAFDVEEGDKLYKTPEDRIKIW